MNNIYHAIFHAVPSYEHASSELEPAEIDNATLVPLLHPRTPLSSIEDVRGWYAWEFTARTLSARPSASLFDETVSLFRRRCTCFERVEGSGAAFNFNSMECMRGPHTRAPPAPCHLPLVHC